jgi:hypothetical protein
MYDKSIVLEIDGYHVVIRRCDNVQTYGPYPTLADAQEKASEFPEDDWGEDCMVIPEPWYTVPAGTFKHQANRGDFNYTTERELDELYRHYGIADAIRFLIEATACQ